MPGKPEEMHKELEEPVYRDETTVVPEKGLGPTR